MIPRTFPSEFVTPNGKTQAIVYSLPSVSGLKAWIDYIPVKGVANSNTVVENTYAADGYMLVRNLDAISGMTPFKDYIPVYEDAMATKPWSTDVGGYIPMYGLFSIQGLFAAGEQGVWYDPSDFNSYMSVLGPELVTNGNFSNGTTGWNATGSAILSVVSGALRVENGAVVTGGSNQIVSTVAGRWYQFTYYVNPATSGGAVIRARDAVSLTVLQTATQNTAGTYTFTFVAIGSTTQIQSINSSNPIGAYHEIDNVSVKELTAINNATLFQDSAGTTPVTAVEQPVGLMLDKSKGLVLGPELFVGGDGTNTTGWTGPTGNGSFVSSGGRFILTASNPISIFTDRVASKTVSGLVVGRTYVLSATLRNINATNLGAQLAISGVATVSTLSTSDQQLSLRFSASSTTATVQLLVSAGAGAQIEADNISVKELPGNHAFQATSANRPVLSARVNLLTKTQAFDDAVWTALNGTTKNSANSFTLTATTSRLYESVSIPANVSHTISATFSSADVGKSIRLAVFDSVNGWNLSSDITIPADGVVSGVFTLTNAGTLAGFQAASTLGGNTSFTLASGKGVDLRVTNVGVNLPAYQRVNTSTDYDTTGFPLYLKFNGTNSSMATNSINFTATDKMTMWAGLRKLSDAAAGVVVETSASFAANAGSFLLMASDGNLPNWTPYLCGTDYTGQRCTTFTAPITNVISVGYDIAQATSDLEISPRINGVIPTKTLITHANAGTGNFGTYPMYIGARAGTSTFFNGQLYSLIVRGAASTSAQITAAETWVNTKTGAY